MADTIEFVDECLVNVRGGSGGNGAVAFRRESHVPRGGPNGGDGGDGGSVIFEADEAVTSLIDLQRLPHRVAGDGAHGEGNNRTGSDGNDSVIRVPVGTVVMDRDSGLVLADLARHGERWVAARGGRAGRGNSSFTNRYRRIPRFSEYGEKVADRWLALELKLIADVGLVGFPSAGKSSLITRLSAATPRVESWPFTTLTPHLGVMRAGDVAGVPIDVVLADVPGLVEGASDGRGLGHQFLRHIERCLVILHVIDCAPFDPDRDPLDDLAIIRRELGRHDSSLLERPQVIALNKLDLPDGQAMADLVRPALEEQGEDVVEISAVSGLGLDELRYRLGARVEQQREEVGRVRMVEIDPDDELVIRLAPSADTLEIERDEDGVFVVRSEKLSRWIQMIPLENPEAVRYLRGRMRRAGVERALVAAGARDGDEVVIGDSVFDFDPELRDLPEDERAAILAAEFDDGRAEGDEGFEDDSREDFRGPEFEVAPGDDPGLAL